MFKRSAPLLIDDIYECIEKIEWFSKDLQVESLRQDDKTIDAIARNLTIIGEAANRLPESFKNSHAGIEWNKIIALRHRIVHEYFGIDLEIIWQILKNDLPLLKAKIESIRNEFKE